MSSFHERGIAALADRYSPGSAHVGEGGLGPIVTPGQIEAKIVEVNAAVEALDAAIVSYVPRPEALADWHSWLNGWTLWRDAWRTFRENPPSTWWGGTADLVLHYQQRLAAWQQEFAQRWRGAMPGPGFPVPPPPETWWQRVTSGVTIAVGAGLILWLLREAVTSRTGRAPA